MPNTSASRAISTAVSPENLALYEVQKPFIEPALRWGRLWNTTLDILFYDVGVLTSALLAKGMVINTGAPANSGSPTHPLENLLSVIVTAYAAGNARQLSASSFLHILSGANAKPSRITDRLKLIRNPANNRKYRMEHWIDPR